jgi:predicted amidohydrolase
VIEHTAVDASRTVRVAVCQTLCIDSDVEGNLQRVANGARQAVAIDAEIACFPEAAIIGWINPEAHAHAEPIPGALSDRIAAIARANEIMIAIGLTERDGERTYDSAILVDSTGEILLKHRKINTLEGLIDPPYASGSVHDVTAVETRIGRVGMLICADTFIEANVDAAGAASPDILIVPYGWAADPGAWPGHARTLEACVVAVSRRVGCPVVGTDLVGSISAGPWKGKTYGGQSVVVDGAGRVLGVLRDRDVDVQVFDIEIESGESTP